MIDPVLLNILACPACAGRPQVQLNAKKDKMVCMKCGREYPIQENIPVMLAEKALPKT